MTTTRFLPEGAKARLGKGYPFDIMYSPDSPQFEDRKTNTIFAQYVAESHKLAVKNLYGHCVYREKSLQFYQSSFRCKVTAFMRGCDTCFSSLAVQKI